MWQSTLLTWMKIRTEAASTPSQPRRRIIIHDSDDDQVVQPRHERGIPHSDLPPPLISDSDDNEEPISRARDDSGSPVSDQPPPLISDSEESVEEANSDVVQADVAQHMSSVSTIDPLNLWKVLPKTPCQYLDMTARHDSDDCADNSLFDSDSSELSAGFISETDDAVNGVLKKHQKFVRQRLPITRNALAQASRSTSARKKNVTSAAEGRAVTVGTDAEQLAGGELTSAAAPKIPLIYCSSPLPF